MIKKVKRKEIDQIQKKAEMKRMKENHQMKIHQDAQERKEDLNQIQDKDQEDQKMIMLSEMLSKKKLMQTLIFLMQEKITIIKLTIQIFIHKMTKIK